jgi:hypothetical protein
MGMIGITVGDFSAMNDEGEVVSSGGDLIDLCLISSETVGWLNHYAAEARLSTRDFRRPVRLPWRTICVINAVVTGAMGCYGTGLCKSRAQAYRDWAMRCRAQHEETKLGSGFILSGVAADLRQGVQNQDARYEKAFYGYGSSFGGNFSGN